MRQSSSSWAKATDERKIVATTIKSDLFLWRLMVDSCFAVRNRVMEGSQLRRAQGHRITSFSINECNPSFELGKMLNICAIPVRIILAVTIYHFGVIVLCCVLAAWYKCGGLDTACTQTSQVDELDERNSGMARRNMPCVQYSFGIVYRIARSSL